MNPVSPDSSTASRPSRGLEPRKVQSVINSRRITWAIPLATLFGLGAASTPSAGNGGPIVYDGFDGPGKGKNIVLICGDEEYRSEEMIPQLGKILAKHHGFRCTILFPIDTTDGTINPNQRDNIPYLETLRKADLAVIFLRFRNLPSDQMKEFVNYLESGRPIVAIRTSTHSFDIPEGSEFAEYGWKSKQWDGGFGRQVLGETWISHHGKHGEQSCRGVIAESSRSHPIALGIGPGAIWGPTDVYGVRLPLPGDCQPIVLGEVVAGMKPTDPAVVGPQNEPLMPIAWTKTYSSPSGKSARIFTTTMGSSQDLQSEGYRRLLVNACYWALAMESRISPDDSVNLVGDYRPTPFKFNGYTKGLRPGDHLLKP